MVCFQAEPILRILEINHNIPCATWHCLKTCQIY